MIGFLFFVLLSLGAACTVENNRPERLIGFWKVERAGNIIQVSVYPEINPWNSGSFYVYEAIDRSGINTEIMSFRHDDIQPIDANSIRFVTESTAYVFNGWKFAVTVNGGKDWTIWDAEASLQGWRCCNYYLIKTVELDERGIGKMYLNSNNKEIGILHTNDFGRTWFSAE